MQNDRTASVAGKDIKTYKLEMRQQKRSSGQTWTSRRNEKNEEATVVKCLPVFMTINFSSQSSAPENADDCDEKAFCFWFGRILLC